MYVQLVQSAHGLGGHTAYALNTAQTAFRMAFIWNASFNALNTGRFCIIQNIAVIYLAAYIAFNLYILSFYAFPGNQTHDFGIADSMLYCSASVKTLEVEKKNYWYS